MIHLVAGLSALGTLKESSVPGEKFSIDDLLMEGPIVDGLQTAASWIQRAEYLEKPFSIERSEYLAGKAEHDRILNLSLSHDEIVLWFEFDLHCQANLLYYLDWYASRDLGATRLTLICPERVPSREEFRGLGELRAEELESLFPGRADVTADQKRVAQAAWQSFSNEDPRSVEKFLQFDSSALPLVAPAFCAHLERFPSTANGLGIVAQKTLEILCVQPLPFHKLFSRVNSTPELFRHGMGDLTLQSYIDTLSLGPSALVHGEHDVEITENGRNVLESKADAIDLLGIDVWFGGVHLTPGNLWRWDRSRQILGRS
jgi:hypothetical protein